MDEGLPWRVCTLIGDSALASDPVHHKGRYDAPIRSEGDSGSTTV